MPVHVADLKAGSCIQFKVHHYKWLMAGPGMCVPGIFITDPQRYTGEHMGASDPTCFMMFIVYGQPP